MDLGNMPKDGGNLILSVADARVALAQGPDGRRFLRGYVGSQEFVQGGQRKCLWVMDDEVDAARSIHFIDERIDGVREMRLASPAASTRAYAAHPHRFKQIQGIARSHSLIIPQVTSERREYLPVGLLPSDTIVSNLAFALYDAPLWNLALIASSLHLEVGS